MKFGILSIIFFILYQGILLLKEYAFPEINPITSIIVAFILLTCGIIMGWLGIKNNTQKKLSILGLILNILGVIFFGIGLLEGFGVI